MTPRIIIPIRSMSQGKSRLAGVLSPAARATLVDRMFRHVLGVAERFGPTWVVSRDPELLGLSTQPIPEQGDGLNPAVEQAAATVPEDGPVLALNADLPLLTAADLQAMTALLERADVIAAPDRTGIGTNALLLARPRIIPYRFGGSSLAAHRGEAEAKRFRFTACCRPGLATDIDRPQDLRHLPTGYW